MHRLHINLLISGAESCNKLKTINFLLRNTVKRFSSVTESHTSGGLLAASWYPQVASPLLVVVEDDGSRCETRQLVGEYAFSTVISDSQMIVGLSLGTCDAD